MAVLLEVYSGNSAMALTPERLRALLAVSGGSAPRAPAPRTATPISQRLPRSVIENIARRCAQGQSVRSLADETGVAASALVRLLRDEGVVVEKRKVSKELAHRLAKEYKSGATMRELEARYGLSHGVVFRALHRPNGSSGAAIS